MFEDIREQVESTVAPLVRGILDDTQTLLRQELALAKVEIRGDVARFKAAEAEMGIAVWSGMLATLMFSFAVAHLLVALFEALPLWGAYSIVGMLLTVAAAALFAAASKRMKSVKVLPEETVETMRENVQWIQRKA